MVEEARRSGKTDHDSRTHGRRPANRGCGADSRPRWPDAASSTGRPRTGLLAPPAPAGIIADRIVPCHIAFAAPTPRARSSLARNLSQLGGCR